MRARVKTILPVFNNLEVQGLAQGFRPAIPLADVDLSDLGVGNVVTTTTTITTTTTTTVSSTTTTTAPVVVCPPWRPAECALKSPPAVMNPLNCLCVPLTATGGGG